MGYGMIWFGVPHKLYPAGYHCNPKQPLPFLGLASQKIPSTFITWAFTPILHYMIGSRKPMQKVATAKLDMGKSCIPLRNPNISLMI